MSTPHILSEHSHGISRHSLAEEAFGNFEVYCTGDINMESVNSLIQQLQYLNNQNPVKEITMYINSGGGSVQQGLALYDVMQALTNPIKTVCIGTAASMAAILFLAGTRRLLLDHSCVMIHDPLTGSPAGGSALSIKNLSDSIMKTREVLCGIIAKHSNKSIEEIYEKTSVDTFFYGQEAVDYDLADAVLSRLERSV